MTQSRLTRLVIAALLCGSCPVSLHAQGGGKEKSAQQLEQELAARDAAIAELRRRIEALEAKATTPVPRTPEPPVAQPERPVDEAVDEELLARALERSLVLSGGVLLPRGQREIETGLQYDYYRRSGLGIVGTATIANQDVRRDNYSANFTLRAGLPWASQLEFTIPYGYQKVESITAETGSRADDTGIGDIQLGVSRQLLFEGSGRPALIANLAWHWASGDSNLVAPIDPDTGLPIAATSLGVGYDVLSATLTAVKRMDPLVFLGSLSHSFNRSTGAGNTRLNPGDSLSGSFQAILAASPNVSLRTGFSLARTASTTFNGSTLPSSEQTIALLELGGSVVLARRNLLDVTVGAGLTDDSPDFLLNMSLPIRF